MELTLLPNYLPVLYLFVHTLLVVISPFTHSRKVRLLGLNLLVGAGFLCMIYWSGALHDTWPAGARLFLLWSPIVFFWIGYIWAGTTLTAVHPAGFTYDDVVMRIEEKFFGQPSLWLARNRGRWVTDLMHFFYASYYAYTPILGIYLFDQQRYREFEAMSFAVLFGYFVSYPLFALVPVAGPRWSLVETGRLSPSEQRLEGHFLTRLMGRLMWDGLAHKGGAMPSSHSSTAVVFLIWSWRIWGFDGVFWAGIVVFGMWIGSVYGRYHFLVDVLAGAAIGLGGVILADALILG